MLSLDPLVSELEGSSSVLSPLLACSSLKEFAEIATCQNLQQPLHSIFTFLSVGVLMATTAVCLINLFPRKPLLYLSGWISAISSTLLVIALCIIFTLSYLPKNSLLSQGIDVYNLQSISNLESAALQTMLGIFLSLSGLIAFSIISGVQYHYLSSNEKLPKYF
jgi:hypothetical protein